MSCDPTNFTYTDNLIAIKYMYMVNLAMGTIPVSNEFMLDLYLWNRFSCVVFINFYLPCLRPSPGNTIGKQFPQEKTIIE